MAFLNSINTKAKAFFNSGFGTNSNSYGGRFLNKDGTANVQKRGMGFFNRISWYHTLLDMPTWKFIMIILIFYIVINFAFALIYFVIGIEYLNGIDTSSSTWVQFGQAYFFSAQTFTTVGYGHISPSGFLTSAISAAEALTGLLSFAIATGLFFGRFSKPVAFLKFSHNAIIAPYQDITALMIRITPYKNTNFTDIEAKITLGMNVLENGNLSNKFYFLDLEYDKINALNLSWTLVHPITEESPLFQFDAANFANTTGEIMVYIKTFDDMYSTVVATRTSYTFEEVVYGAKFKPMYSRSSDNSKTILHLNMLNEFERQPVL
ncbi:ion channel [Flavobacterium franklandianum]|uniref:Inward rectifier potassium channel Irk n=1 Tax=Flavobacterium franklandianum TaxID=2594430 RepID=A0A553C7Z6_9FLAO|nr:ion channel [Flavobacterium franklandianum]TRX16644.1 Inward rectifier potassium channel Irk [Flavobacterium franklandianum]